MSDSNNTTAGTERVAGALEAAYHRLREPIERCRCLEEFPLVSQHVRLEGLIVREGSKREIVASGARVLIRSQPVGSTPVESELEESSRGTSWSWFDPVPEGKQLQRSREIFIDRGDIAEFIRGLRGFRRIPERWPEHTLREHEAVFAWENQLVFRTVKRNFQSVDYFSSVIDPPINLRLPAGQVGQLTTWLTRLSTALTEAEGE